jgi:hypothetical protein
MISKMLCVALLLVIGVALLGRAIDQAVQQRVLITRGGQTLDCERVHRNGRVFLSDCEKITP